MSKLKKIFFMFLILFTTKTSIANFTKKTYYSGQICLPKANKASLEQPRLYYNGSNLKLDNNNCFNFESVKLNQVNILIINPENINLTSEDNTIKSLNIKSKSNYKFYTLTYSKNSNNWKEKLINLASSKIPLNTIIILINPDSINLKFETNLDNNNYKNIKIPKINISIDNKYLSNLDEIIAKSILGGLDIEAFHSRPKTKNLVFNRALIASQIN